MKKHIKIQSDIYPVKFHILLDFKDITTLKKCIKFPKKETVTEVHKLIDELDLDAAHGYTLMHKGNIFVMVKEFFSSPECYDTLCHELIHAVNMSAEYLGITYSKESEEYYAYLYGFLMRKTMEQTRY